MSCKLSTNGDRIDNSFVIARDAGGKMLRKTDIILDRWEVINDEETSRGLRHCFDERDRLAVAKAEEAAKAADVK
jgi:hypothetical protein